MTEYVHKKDTMKIMAELKKNQFKTAEKIIEYQDKKKEEEGK